MKKTILSLIALTIIYFVDAQLCCNVVSSNGLAVVTTNGVCVVAPNLLSGDCMADSDGDGIADNEDKCPHEAGDAANEGCPTLSED